MTAANVSLGVGGGPAFPNPIRGILHGSASLMSWALVFYFSAHPTQSQWLDRLLVGCALSHATLFAVSAGYHSLPWGPIAKARMQRLDHSMIYVKIAGSMAPLAWLSFEPHVAWSWILAIWSIALVGIAQKAFLPRIHPKASAFVQLVQGFLCLPILMVMAERYPGGPVQTLLAGGFVYALGALVFLLERPRLWPRVFSYHELFHVFVMIGSAALVSTLVGLAYGR